MPSDPFPWKKPFQVSGKKELSVFFQEGVHETKMLIIIADCGTCFDVKVM